MKNNDNTTGGACGFNPPISDEEISLALDGDVDAIRQSNPNRDFTKCIYCAENGAMSCVVRLREAYQFEEELRQKLFRFDCPDTSLIGKYARSQLQGSELERVRKHLEVCTLCRTEVAHVRRYQVKLEPTSDGTIQRSIQSILRSPLVWLANLVGGDETALATRGGDFARGDSPRRIVTEVNDVTIFVEIIKDEDDDAYTLEGQVLASSEEWESALVELSGDSFKPRLTVVDEIAEFKFEDVQSDNVLLKITGQEGIAILLPEIDLHAEEESPQ